MPRAALGKGLNALFRDQEEPTTNQVIEISLDQIVPNSKQPRLRMDEAKLKELSATIKEKGVLQPILVSQADEGYEIIAGERRWRAAGLAGLSTIPCIVKEITLAERVQWALIENIQRENLNPIELAFAYQEIIKTSEITPQALSEQVGKSRVSIVNTMRLLKLPTSIQEMIINDAISEGHGRSLLSIESDHDKLLVAQRIIDEKLSVREVEQIAQSFSHGMPLPPNLGSLDQPANSSTLSNRALEDPMVPTLSSEVSLDPFAIQHRTYHPDVVALEEELTHLFGTRTRILSKGSRGKIVLEYYNLDDFDRILDVLRVKSNHFL